MRRIPTRAEIDAAERKVVQSRLIIRNRLRLVRLACRATLARPSTILLIMATAGIAGYRFARRWRTTSSSAGVRIAATTSVAGVIGAFILQQGMRHLPFFFQHVWTTWQARVTKAGPAVSKASESV